MNVLNCIAQNMVMIQGAFKTVRQRSVRSMGALTPPGAENREALLVLRQMSLEMKKTIKHLQITLRYYIEAASGGNDAQILEPAKIWRTFTT